MINADIISDFRQHASQVEQFYDFCKKDLKDTTLLYVKDFIYLINKFLAQSTNMDLDDKLIELAEKLKDMDNLHPFYVDSMFNFLYILCSQRLSKYSMIAVEPDLNIIIFYNHEGRRDNQTISIICKSCNFVISVIARKEGIVKFRGVLEMEKKAYFRIEEILDLFFD